MNANQATTYVPGQRSRKWHPLWDTYSLAADQATPTTIPMLIHTRSEHGLNVTNLVQKNMTPAGVGYTIQAVRVAFIGMDEVDINKFFQQYTLVLKVGSTGTVELEAPLWALGAGGGISGAVALKATDSTIKQWTNGLPSQGSIQSLETAPILLEGPEIISIDLMGTTLTTTAAICIQVLIDGIEETPIRG
jgi:hypothetical protein